MRYLFNKDLSNKFENAKSLTAYHNNLMRVINCIQLLSEYYVMDSEIENINPKCLKTFLTEDLNNQFIFFEEVYEFTRQQSSKK